MGALVTFQNTLLPATGKRGILTPIDASGYYAINFGGLDVYNEADGFYVAETAKELFLSSSHLMRRCGEGKLFNELGHPKMIPGMTDQQYMIRILTVYEDNACSHTRKIHLEEVSDPKLNNGKPFIRIIGEVKPMGHLGQLVEDTFKTADSDASYSIRSITHDNYVNGVRYKNIKEIATWDYVLEPGIRHATKYYSASTESMTLNKESILKAIDLAREDKYGLESASAIRTLSMLANIAEDIERFERRKIYLPPTVKW